MKLRLALLLVLLAAWSPAVADVTVGGWMAHSPDDIPGGFATLTGNDATVDVTLPFTFTIEGTGYTTLALSTNGWIEFGGNTSPNSDPSNDCLPTPAHSNPFLAAYWDDLNPFGTSVRYGTVGQSPNRVFVADYEVDLTSGVEGQDDLRFQIELHERSNVATVRYRDSQNNANGQSATIGFQGAGAAAATAYPLVCNGKILDDNRPDEGWSADVGRAGRVTLAALVEHSPDDIGGFTTLTGDEATANVTLPFSVTIEGTSYSTLTLSTNGWLEFGGNTSGSTDFTNTCLPVSNHTNPFLAAYWDDLNPFGTSVRYGTVGQSPNRVFIADYEADLFNGEGDDDLRFQVQVHERSNLINVRYRDAQANANGQLATIGFQGAGGSAAAAYPLACNGKILDDNDAHDEGWSVHPKAVGRAALHGAMAHSPDDIAGFTSLSGNDSTATVTLPFGLTIDGTSYTTVAISTNGWLEFGGNTAADSDPSNDCLPTPFHTNPFLAAYWDDMRTINTAIRYGTVGTSGGRIFIVDIDFENNDANNHDMTMQVQVHERSNVITVKYRDSQNEANGSHATIGFQRAGGAAATAHPLTCNGKILDDNRPTGGWSVAPEPVCGNGILEPLGGEQCDAGGSNGSASGCCTAACQFRAAGQVCRAGGGAPCDLDETCTGASASCPPDDAPGKAGITCRLGSADACDPDEVCNGAPGVACPPDVITPSGTLCRAGSGDVCDPAETCTGNAGETCPANVVNGGSTVCRTGSGDACDANETCSGIPGATCPPDDAPLNAGTVCRPGSGDVCDQNEACTGTPGAACPPDDAPGKAGFICRPSSVAGAFCDEPEACTGAPGGTCPPNDAPGKVNVVCRQGSGDLCDPDERCTGVSGQGCPPDVVANPTTVCRVGSGDTCDPDETCTAVPGVPCPADVVKPSGTLCRAATGTCDVAEHCTGDPGEACPDDAFAAPTTPCNLDSDVCTVDQCDGDGTCAPGAPMDCEDGNVCTQDTCDPDTGCVSTGAPSTSCVPASRATFQLKRGPIDLVDRLKFTWRGGPVLLPDMGDPTQTTRYELCVYDANGVKLAMGVPPGAGWSPIGSSSSPSGYKFKDRTGQHFGIGQMSIKGSSLDKAKEKVAAKGPGVPDTALPFLLPVTAQLYASDGVCWEAEFGAAETRRNEGDAQSGLYSGKKTVP